MFFILDLVISNSSDSANFWFYAHSSSRLEVVVTEMSFLVVLAPSWHALLADTFVEIERSTDIDGNAGVSLGCDFQMQPHVMKSCP